MIEEQVAKRAAAADAESNAKLAAAAESAANADKKAATAKPEAKKIDIGTVAAMGVAVGAIGGALGAIATGLAKLAFWQLPLVFVGLVAVISGPSMLIAWLKLRQRNIGPLLEINGWAINGRVMINIPFGTKLTDRAIIPAGSKRNLTDPYADKDAARRKKLVWTLVIVAILAATYIRYDHNQNGRYFWQPAPVATPPIEASAAPAPAVPAPNAPPTP